MGLFLLPLTVGCQQEGPARRRVAKKKPLRLKGKGVLGTLYGYRTSGAEGSRTPGLLNAIQALFQLSYSPKRSGGGTWWS